MRLSASALTESKPRASAPLHSLTGLDWEKGGWPRLDKGRKREEWPLRSLTGKVDDSPLCESAASPDEVAHWIVADQAPQDDKGEELRGWASG